MTAKGLIRSLKLSRQAATIWGTSVIRRSGEVDLKNTPLELLHAAGAKLLKSARRSGRDAVDIVSISTLTRGEAMALWHDVAFCFHPDASATLLSNAEKTAARAVVRALVPLLGAKRGPERMARVDAQSVVDRYQERGSISEAIEIPDAAQATRLARRLKRQSALEATPVVRIPPLDQTPKKKNNR